MAIMVPRTLLILGRPGSGKSTQFERLHAHIPEPALFLSFGTLVREFMRGESTAAKKTREILDAGKMLPTFLSTAVWAPYLFERFTGDEHLVIEGAPRHLFEAEALDSFFDLYERPQSILVANINVSKEDAVQRLAERAITEGRTDDMQMRSIQSRQDWYEKETLPTMEYLRTHQGYRVVDIDGSRSIDAVEKEITALLT